MDGLQKGVCVCVLAQDNLKELLDKYRTVYLPATFAVGTFTFGLKTAMDNFSIMGDVSVVCVHCIAAMCG